MVMVRWRFVQTSWQALMDRGEYVLDLICHFSIQAMIIKFNIFLLFVKYRFDETYFDVTWIQYISLAGKEKMKGVLLGVKWGSEWGLALGHVLYVDLSFGMEKNRFSFSTAFSHKSLFCVGIKSCGVSFTFPLEE